jgi:hypothetical protein
MINLKKTVMGDAPSIQADSSMLAGIVSKKERKRIIYQ